MKTQIKKMFRHSLFIAVALCLGLSLSSCASIHASYSVGQKAFIQQDYHKAFAYLHPAALAGNSNAQYAIGYMYYYGLGVAKDDVEARIWLTEAAKNHQKQAVQALKMIEKAQPNPYTWTKPKPQYAPPPTVGRVFPSPTRSVGEGNARQLSSNQAVARVKSSTARSVGEVNTLQLSSNQQKTLLASQQRLSKLKSSDYTLQLMASNNWSDVNKFISQNQLQELVNVIKTSKNGHSLFEVSGGDYPSLAAAKADIINLPPKLKAMGPWPRMVKDLV